MYIFRNNEQHSFRFFVIEGQPEEIVQPCSTRVKFKFFGIPENMQDSVAKEENVKQILTKAK